jgi:dolichyl-phosphate beta-glucosyltransferase
MQPRKPARDGDEAGTSLVFPTYNPGPVLERTWCQLEHFLKHDGSDWEAVFVCDGCTDGASTRLAALGRHMPGRVKIIEYSPNRGKGYALRKGLAAARGRYRIFTDIDLAYGFDDILRLAAALKGGADVAIASRTHPDSRLLLPPHLQGYVYRRHLQSLIFSKIVRWILPVTQADTQAGLKGMHGDVAERMLPRLRCDGFEFDCEFLTACVRNGLMIAEVPVCVRYSDAVSTTSLHSIGRMVRELWNIRRAWPPALDQRPDEARLDRDGDHDRQAA